MACQAVAQDSLLLRDYSYVKQHDAWLSLEGTAALTRYRLANIVEAEATLTKGNGGLVDYYQSDDWLEGNVSIELLSDGHRLKCIISDAGIPFDPTETADADTTSSVEDRRIGGLGIYLLRQLMDTINYERIDGKNVLTLRKYYKK
jgi:hypothetical protein